MNEEVEESGIESGFDLEARSETRSVMTPLPGTCPTRAPRNRRRKGIFQEVSHLWFYVLSLHLAGHTTWEICEVTGYQPSTIYTILNDPRTVAVRQQMLYNTDKEFEALFSKVVGTIRNGLNSSEFADQMKAADMWLKANGKYQKKEEAQGVTVTAEDVVINILNQNGTEGAKFNITSKSQAKLGA